MNYEVNEANSLTIFFKETALLVQPCYPNGEAFESREAAQSWAEAFIASYDDETAPWPNSGQGTPAPARRKFLEEGQTWAVWNAETETWEPVPEEPTP